MAAKFPDGGAEMPMKGSQDKMKLTLLAILISMPSAAAKKAPEPESQPELVRMVELLANPERFNGRPVTVKGYLVIGDRGVNAGARLCLSREDSENGLGNCAGVVPSPGMHKEWKELTGKYVRMTGMVVTSNPGAPQGRWIMIEHISECEVWSDPSHPRASADPSR